MGETANIADHCWKRIAFILGHALIGKFRVLTDQDLPDYVRESLGDALKPCGRDEEFLKDSKVIREQVFQLVKLLRLLPTKIEEIIFDLADNYEETINEIKRIKGIVGRRGISLAEAIYVLGLAFIVSEAIRLGKGVSDNDVDEVLHVLSLSTEAMDSVEIINRWRDILIGPLFSLLSISKVPHRELMLLAKILSINVPHNYVNDSTIKYFLGDLDFILKEHYPELANKAWPLVFATQAYSELLRKYAGVLKKNKKLKKTANKLKGILDDLKSISHNLYTVALAYALIPLTEVGIDLSIDGGDVFNELSSMLDKVSELMQDKYFMDYVKANYIGDVGEEHVKNVILHAMSHLGDPLAERYLKETMESFNNDELGNARKLLNEVAMIKQRLGHLNEYLTAQGGALCIEAIELLMNFNNEKYSELIGKYEQLLDQAEKGRVSVPQILGQYLVLLALGGDANSVNRISELIDKYQYELNRAKPIPILTKFMLKALLKPVVKQGSKLDEELEVDENEIIDTFTGTNYLHANDLLANLETITRGLIIRGFNIIKGSMDQIKMEWIVYFQKGIEELEKEARIDKNRAEKINEDFVHFLEILNDASSAQLLVGMDSIARFALMLNALVNDEIDLAKAHALLGSVVKYAWILDPMQSIVDVTTPSKLYTRLFLDAYDNCCDSSNNNFRLALTKLYLSTIFEHTLLETIEIT